MSARGGAVPAARALAPLDPAARQPDASDALALTQLVREAVAAELPREVLHLRLSRLAGRMRQDHHRRLLREALEPALRPVRSRLFQLPNGDLVAVAPAGGRHLREAEAVLALLLAPGEGEALPGALHAMLELPRDAAALLVAVEEAIRPASVPPLPPAVAPFSPAELAALEQALRGASLARFLRRRPVCRLLRGGPGPVPVWEEWGLAWPELRAALCPEADPAATPCLARRLLDRRLLAELARPEELRSHGPMGLSLAVATLGEPEFLRLDALLDAPGRAATVLALPAEDALAEPEAFAFARDFARARGYRLALDLPGPGLLEVLPFGRLGVDILRLRWSPDLAAARAGAGGADRRRSRGRHRLGVGGRDHAVRGAAAAAGGLQRITFKTERPSAVGH
jgi:hypothetical protein